MIEEKKKREPGTERKMKGRGLVGPDTATVKKGHSLRQGGGKPGLG